MKKLLFLICSFPLIAQAQLTTGMLKCTSNNKSDIPFQIQFTGKDAILHLRNEMYQLKFSEFLVDKEGYKWSIYKNKQLTVSTQLPNKKLTSVFRNEYLSAINFTMINPLTDGQCN